MKRLPESEYERVLRYAKSDKLSPYERRNGLSRRQVAPLDKAQCYDKLIKPRDFVWKPHFILAEGQIVALLHKSFVRPTEAQVTMKWLEPKVMVIAAHKVGYEQCLSCREWKPRKEFSPRPDKRNGLQSYCKACRADGERGRRAA